MLLLSVGRHPKRKPTARGRPSDGGEVKAARLQVLSRMSGRGCEVHRDGSSARFDRRGVAIAVTLLVLDLPSLDGGREFVHRLLEHWPTYAAYLVSFVSIGVIWIEHHGMMIAVRFINRPFLERTLVVLLSSQ